MLPLLPLSILMEQYLVDSRKASKLRNFVKFTLLRVQVSPWIFFLLLFIFLIILSELFLFLPLIFSVLLLTPTTSSFLPILTPLPLTLSTSVQLLKVSFITLLTSTNSTFPFLACPILLKLLSHSLKSSSSFSSSSCPGFKYHHQQEMLRCEFN